MVTSVESFLIQNSIIDHTITKLFRATWCEFVERLFKHMKCSTIEVVSVILKMFFLNCYNVLFVFTFYRYQLDSCSTDDHWWSCLLLIIRHAIGNLTGYKIVYFRFLSIAHNHFASIYTLFGACTSIKSSCLVCV